ncbi:MAG: hypothetical protein NC081_05690 [Roseburia sp.]|nr:hypothetical protein [Roseburia sp.]
MDADAITQEIAEKVARTETVAAAVTEAVTEIATETATETVTVIVTETVTGIVTETATADATTEFLLPEIMIFPVTTAVERTADATGIHKKSVNELKREWTAAEAAVFFFVCPKQALL